MIFRVAALLAFVLIEFSAVSNVVWAQQAVVRRTTLLVRDSERSRQFYQALGFREWLDWSEAQDPESLTGLPLNAKSTNSRIVIMAGTDPYVAMIGLLEYDKPPLTPSRPPNQSIGLNDIVIVIETTDMTKVERNLKSIGAQIARQLKAYKSKGPAGPKTGVDMLVYDPDGYLVEVSQVLNNTVLPQK